VARTLERASGIGGGSNAAGPGCKTRFPSRGGVDLLMNSIVVGSLDAACRRTKENKKSVKKKRRAPICIQLTIAGQLLTNGDSAYLEYHSTRRNARKEVDEHHRRESMGIAHRVAQNSNVPFPLPIRVSFP